MFETKKYFFMIWLSTLVSPCKNYSTFYTFIHS
uniref:Uncharacterized protein n=1 Tax=Anguilla anguilla TaxID=7936 RepID=A0A0E9XGK4_ANGAN